MAKEGNTATASWFRDLFSLGVYKRTQGRIARQATFAALALIVILGAWSLNGLLSNTAPWLASSTRVPLLAALAGVGIWICFRAVNLPRFADFLIAVEAEMNKVSWPTRTELFRSVVVVIVVIFGMAAVLLAYDLIWRFALQLLGVISGGSSGVAPQ